MIFCAPPEHRMVLHHLHQGRQPWLPAASFSWSSGGPIQATQNVEDNTLNPIPPSSSSINAHIENKLKTHLPHFCSAAMAAEPITVRPIQQLHSTLPATHRRPRSSSARTNSHDHQTPISSSRSAILSASIRPVDGRHPHLLPSSSTVSHKPAADHLHLAVTPSSPSGQ
ncbi:hypothetical protein ACLOJK_023784 [Asimina triloba]